eukprot:CAMPEP_0197828308 /NCGR_PEP_ID=MMETSP1437-20131217/4897_1 /TAXON_ID=49252 ORGANISM="Eucampia antarctica, Strain CCMP1452" /NCGR_SAMPLE_ID=MMETSP1437 /ASSEMBLY_ACC=CAM_ASM_001096 /LENGTH=547 /DNA_ID=CAMNT_0043429479 /DNA_START=75 /DNA_END=1715 /DNA_ORIENTATION=-
MSNDCKTDKAMNESTNQDAVSSAKLEGEVVTDDKKQQRDGRNRTDAFSLKIKGQFVLEECSPILSPQQQVSEPPSQPFGERKENRNKKNKRGQNKGKKRPRDSKIDQGQKICKATMLGKECSFGDSCKFNHDVKLALANRPEDIKEIGICPNFKLRGWCEYGIMCRTGKCHLNIATGENIRNEDFGKPQPAETTNLLRKDVQVLLRKKKYPFVCQRNQKNGGKNTREKESTGEQLSTNKEKENTANVDTTDKEKDKTTSIESKNIVDTSPLPEKRKLIDFSNKVYVAPLTTVGNLPFRRIMKRFGADITCGEMAVAQNLLEGKSGEWALLKRHPDEDIFGVQIAAGFPDMYTRVCEVIEKEMDVDFVDLNLGCPLDIMCDKGAGASLMLRDKKLKDIVEGVTNTLSCPVTIKMRTGWDESKPIAHKLVSKIQSWGFDGVGAVMIHGRSRLQRYTKLANWKYIEVVANSQSDDLPKIPLIGNGDIFSYTDYEEKIANDSINTTAMLARGALIKPWLPTEIKERRHWDISASERLDILKDFTKFGLEHW